jgi:tripartite-type tricarboxylate transporter receptor subunit TctC
MNRAVVAASLKVLLSVFAAFAMVVATGMAQSAIADEYPTRPIKLIVPFPAGGPTDVAARLIAQSLSSRLGGSVIVENHPGAGGRIGAKDVANALPDGYTLLLGGTNVNALAGAIYSNLGFDPIKSFRAVAAICVDSMALATSPHVPADSFSAFVEYAKSHPGKLTYGAPPGIYTQFAAEFLKVKTGADILFVPYKGAAPAITDLLGGHIDMVFNNKSTLLAHFRDGRLKPLAVTSEDRWPELPNVPTMRELGVAGFPSEVWFGVLAPAKTPDGIVVKLNGAVNESLRSTELRTSIDQLGMEARVTSPEQFLKALEHQAAEWAAVIRAIGIKME